MQTKLISAVILFAICFSFLLASQLQAEEPRPSLKQLIDDPANRIASPGGYPAPSFDSRSVRENFFGDEAAFRREVVSLLQTGENDLTALMLILSLNLGDEAIAKVMREKFASTDSLSRYYICSILARHTNKENIDFLVEVLKQPNHSASLRSSVAYFLSHFHFSSDDHWCYFEGLDDERKNSILNAFMSCLDDEREVHHRFGPTSTVADDVAFHIGYFGSFAEPALPTIKKKYIALQNKDDDVKNKLNLAWSIVRIAPEQCDNELQYILKKAMEDKSKDIRWEAILHLETVPLSLSEKVIPRLYAIIQKETCIRNRIQAADAIKTLLEKQRSPFDLLDEDEDWNDSGRNEMRQAERPRRMLRLLPTLRSRF
jgi:HEAT repeat protein